MLWKKRFDFCFNNTTNVTINTTNITKKIDSTNINPHNNINNRTLYFNTDKRKKERKKRETTEKSGCKLYFIQPYITSAILLDMKRRDILSEGFMV